MFPTASQSDSSDNHHAVLPSDEGGTALDHSWQRMELVDCGVPRPIHSLRRLVFGQTALFSREDLITVCVSSLPLWRLLLAMLN